MAETLLDQVRSKLWIRQKDTETDAQIQRIIANAEQDLRTLLGIPEAMMFDFSAAGTENYLLLNYCWYEWSGDGARFEENYAAQIARCREKWMVRQYDESQAAGSE